MSEIEGFIDKVVDGTIFGRILICGEEFNMETPLSHLEEGQRGYLEAGALFTVVNGSILINKAIWTTKDMEDADADASRWLEHFHQK